jgi:hypothetical protein
MDGEAQRQRVAKNERRKNRRDVGNGGTVGAELIPILFLSNYVRPALKNPPSGIPTESSFGQQSGSPSQHIPQEAPESLDHRSIHIATLRNPKPPIVPVRDLRRNLEALSTTTQS